MEKMTYYELSEVQKEYYQKGNHERFENGALLGAAIGKFLNGCDSCEIDHLIQYITTMEHKTIQQIFFGMVLKSIQSFAELENVDARNKNAHEKAKKLYEFMQSEGIVTNMPFI